MDGAWTVTPGPAADERGLSLSWLRDNGYNVGAAEHGLVLGLFGDPALWSYNRSLRRDALIDGIVPQVLRELDHRRP
jgi:aminopeptidase-like protein